MATTPKPPKLDRQIKALINRMSIEQVGAVAAMRVPRGESKSFAGELIRAIRAQAKAHIEAKSGPLPDEPKFNEETLEAFRELESGGGIRYESVDDLFADLGIEPDHEARVRAASKSVMGRHGSAFKKLAE